MNRLTCAAAILILAMPTQGRAVTLQKVISIEGCGSVQTMPGWLGSQSVLLDDYLLSNEEQMAIYLCDADLPDTATAFDTVGLEYIGGYETAPPWVVAYANEEVRGYDRNRYSWVGAIGACDGVQTPGAINVPYQGPPIFLCQTSGGLSWASDPRQAIAQRLSIFFLVFVPVWTGGPLGNPVYGPEPWNSCPWDEVFRLIVQYEQ